MLQQRPAGSTQQRVSIDSIRTAAGAAYSSASTVGEPLLSSTLGGRLYRWVAKSTDTSQINGDWWIAWSATSIKIDDSFYYRRISGVGALHRQINSNSRSTAFYFNCI
ncbi:unnamed protein product [Gongylonema pulchrum]|uniref:Fibrinogen C-terminal domain-containing protein n=1 Tax=Gongylonema pulchrum TaxID=637853 RepID=A0A183E0M2_9BILA|nr:unnamed protein product [Gongylonema pulchrum]